MLMTQPESSGVARLLRLPLPLIALTELRMGLRVGAFRFVAALLFVIGWSVGGAGGRGSAMSAYATGEIACRYLGVATVLWMAIGAVRDTALRTYVLVYTKPQPPERLALARFLGLYGQVLCFLLALFLGAAVGRLASAGNLVGCAAYGIQFFRAAGALFFAAAATFCLALLADSAVAGVLIALYWVVALGGQDYLAKYYYPWYAQNLAAYISFGVGLLCLALWFTRRRQRGAMPAALTVRLGAPCALGVGAALLWMVIQRGHDPMAVQNPALDRMSMQNIVVGELTPGLLLPDQNGKPMSLSRYKGCILLVALWSPSDPDSALLLARLEAIRRKYGVRGVQPVAICLSEDASAAKTFAVGDQVGFPVVHDWGTAHGSRLTESSPLAIAYQATHLPRVVITDRRHRVRVMLDGLDSYDGPHIDDLINQRLTEEPD
jgi:hypothetical protein